MGPTPNPDLFFIREELLNSSIKNIKETVERIYNCVKNMKELRLHSEYDYFRRIVGGYKAMIATYSSRITLDDETREKFSETLNLMNQTLEKTKNIIK
jgi:hypothetical protein